MAWHYLSENPNDLPRDHERVLILCHDPMESEPVYMAAFFCKVEDPRSFGSYFLPDIFVDGYSVYPLDVIKWIPISEIEDEVIEGIKD